MTIRTFLSEDPAPGTERLTTLSCPICGTAHMNRRGLCDKCTTEAIEFWRAFRAMEQNEFVTTVNINGLTITRNDPCHP